MEQIDFNDLFTEPILPIKISELLENRIDKSLCSKICGPENNIETLKEIKKSIIRGDDHLLYTEYQKKYGDNGFGTNIIIPYLDELDEPVIKSLVLISHPDDSTRLGKKHVNKTPLFKPLLHDSLISTTDKKHWRSQRNDFIEIFTLKSLERTIPVSNKRASECPDLLWKLSDSGKNKVNLNEFFLNESMAQLQTALIGLSPEFEKETNEKIRSAIGGFGEKGYAREYAFKLLEEIKSTPKCPFLHRVQETQTENYGNALLFTFAGHDTTGHTLTWLVYELSKNQIFQIKLQKEIDCFWREQEDREITIKDLSRLKFTTRCISETLRLWPAVANGTFRELDEDDYIIGKNNEKVVLKKGTYVQLSNWSKHRNPDLWGEDVDVFNPDRDFEPEEIYEDLGFKSYNPYSERFSPFSVPPRDCIGRNFSQIEMRLMILYLFKKYNFILTEKQNICSYDKKYAGVNRATLYPKDVYKPYNIENKGMRPFHNGLYVNVIHRQKSSL